MVDLINTALAVVGAAALVVKGLEAFADITPTTKDDKYVSKMKKFLGFVSYWLDVLSAGLPAHKARRK